MNNTLLILALFVSSLSLSQNKKEQIELLSYKIDSLNQVIQKRDAQISEHIELTKIQISNLESELTQKANTIAEKDKTIKASIEKNVQLENDVSKFKQRIHYVNKNYIPVTKISHQVKNKAQNEVTVLLYIENKLIATFVDFGSGDATCNGLSLYSDISEKSYFIEVVDNNTIRLNYSIFYEGEKINNWVRTYVRENEQWKQSKCTGECN